MPWLLPRTLIELPAATLGPILCCVINLLACPAHLKGPRTPFCTTEAMRSLGCFLSLLLLAQLTSAKLHFPVRW